MQKYRFKVGKGLENLEILLYAHIIGIEEDA